MDKTMTRLLAILAALTCAASAQTYRTVTADTNNVIRTNFTLGAGQISGAFAISNVTGLQSELDGKLATNSDASALTNFPTLNQNTTGTASNVTGVVSIANGGTGATNAATALTNFGILGVASVVIGGENITGGNTIVGSGATADDGSGGFGAVAIGRAAVASNSAVAIGYNALGRSAGGGVGSVAVGYQSTSTNRGVAVGYLSVNGLDGVAVGFESSSLNGFAGGKQAIATATNASQIGTGSNGSDNTIQFMSAGSVDTNEWATIAALSTYPTTNISVVGTNNTNTLVFSNGILTSVTTP